MMQKNGKFYTFLLGMQISTTVMESRMEIPLKTKNRTTILSSDTTPGHIPEGI
jgi:hypothetical protein